MKLSKDGIMVVASKDRNTGPNLTAIDPNRLAI